MLLPPSISEKVTVLTLLTLSAVLSLLLRVFLTVSSLSEGNFLIKQGEAVRK